MKTSKKRPSSVHQPLFHKLSRAIQDEQEVISALSSLLDALRIPPAHKGIVSAAIVRQAKVESKEQYPYLSYAVLAVITKYRRYSSRVPLRGFHLLWIVEHFGWKMNCANETLAMLHSLQAWIEGLVDETGTGNVYLNPFSIVSEATRKRLLTQGALSQTRITEPFPIARDAWTHQMMVHMLERYGADFRVYAERVLPITFSSRLMVHTLEMFSLVAVRTCEEKHQGQMTPDIFIRVFDAYGLFCWRVCAFCASAVEEIDHRIILYFLDLYGVSWLKHFLQAFELGQVDNKILNALAAHKKEFKGKTWEEIWPILIAWKVTGKPLTELTKALRGHPTTEQDWSRPFVISLSSKIQETHRKGDPCK